ncbi:MAG TPA: heme o synthase [Opitutaceae bacterium]|nr:heme o synthase [Opitutaceae bacterium]
MIAAAPKALWADYLELTKPRLSSLSVLTALAGYLAARPAHEGWKLFFAVAGTACAAGGVAALNQYMEWDTDALMRRTADRPIPSGKVTTGSAFVLGWGLCTAGLAILFAEVNGLAAFFALLTMVCYLALYTPAKKRSPWATEIGALAGALPPLIGWAAAEGKISALGWMLFGVLLFWQIPHFMAIAWLYRSDYAAAHFPMLSVRDESGRWVARWSLVSAILLVGVSLLPALLGFASAYYLAVAAVAGVWFVGRAVIFLRPAGRESAARRLFFASLAYLPVQLVMLVADRCLIAR